MTNGPTYEENVNLRYLNEYGAQAAADRAGRRDDLAALLRKWDEADEKRLENMVLSMQIEPDSNERSLKDQVREGVERRNEVDALLKRWDEADAFRMQSLLESLRINSDGTSNHQVKDPQSPTEEAAWETCDEPSEEERPKSFKYGSTVIVLKKKPLFVPRKGRTTSGDTKSANLESKSDRDSEESSSNEIRGKIELQKQDNFQHGHSVIGKPLFAHVKLPSRPSGIRKSGKRT